MKVNPDDMMFSFDNIAAYMTATEVTWNTENSECYWNFDEKYCEAGLLSETPISTYASWLKSKLSITDQYCFNINVVQIILPLKITCSRGYNTRYLQLTD